MDDEMLLRAERVDLKTWCNVEADKTAATVREFKAGRREVTSADHVAMLESHEQLLRRIGGYSLMCEHFGRATD